MPNKQSMEQGQKARLLLRGLESLVGMVLLSGNKEALGLLLKGQDDGVRDAVDSAIAQIDMPKEAALASQDIPQDAIYVTRQLLERFDLEVLDQVTDQLEQLVLKARGREEINITTAVELNPEQKASLRKQLDSIYGGDDRYVFSVDPDLMGGMLIRTGDRIIDTSIRTSLNKLEEDLLEHVS